MSHEPSAGTVAIQATPATPASRLMAFAPFAPFAAFALVERLLGPVAALSAGALTSIGLLLFDWLLGERELNLLETGSALMFSCLTAVALTGAASSWTLWRVRLWVDMGLLLLVLFSIMIRRPFTLQQARRHVSAEVAESAAFVRANDILSSVWAFAFGIMVAADALMVMRPQTPVVIAVVMTLAALATAFKFTTTYATRRQKRLPA